ncbi:COG2958 family protein [Methylovulum psychrotolerans]|uniref:HrgA protein n=1 Tax=Methylovulum psychrotolerans TaxID=1704499 RepID=A0A1Z4BY80_9GAMM|nr:HrgA protein [Methylovulum psychrotolerans]ASF46209.1 HrgA protein [Methylovulum psychrotolerans]
MALNLGKRLFEFLQANPDISYTARDIAQSIFEQFPNECAEKKAASTADYIKTDGDLVQQLVAEISGSRPRWQKQHPQLKTTEGRPRRYYWTEKNASEEVDSAEEIIAASDNALLQVSSITAKPVLKLSEHDLYVKLMDYLKVEHTVFSCRIDEKRSSNTSGSGANEWLHPDIVGLEDLSYGWHRELRDCVSVLAERRARLWSFEVKLLINRSNVRKSYFQTVSNSSWAHLGYLVASTVEGDGTMKELRMLAATHGIGVIQLDSENPTESQILIPARERPDIDWDMCNRLTEENSDFVSYIERVKHFHQTGKLNENDWK